MILVKIPGAGSREDSLAGSRRRGLGLLFGSLLAVQVVSVTFYGANKTTFLHRSGDGVLFAGVTQCREGDETSRVGREGVDGVTMGANDNNCVI